MDNRYRVDDILNECLGWTGNGHCDGGDIGSGTINTFSYVVAPARDAIVKTLSEEGLLDDTVIACRNRDDEYEVLWPTDYSEEFCVI